MKNASIIVTFFFCLFLLFNCSERDPDLEKAATLQVARIGEAPHPNPADGDDPKGNEVGVWNRGEIVTYYGEEGDINYFVQKEIDFPEKAYLQFEVTRRQALCPTRETAYLIKIKLSAPLDYNHSVAAVVMPGSMIDSVNVEMPKRDSIVLWVFSSSNVAPGNYSQGFDIGLYLYNDPNCPYCPGVPLPPVHDIIYSLGAHCEGIEVVIIPPLGPGSYMPASPPLFQPRAFEHGIDLGAQLDLLNSLWSYGTVPDHIFFAPPSQLVYDMYMLSPRDLVESE